MLIFDASFVRAKINRAARRAALRAAVALGLVHPCRAFGHEWHSVGGRPCPRNPDAPCSQTVYRCRRCPDYDYGEPGGPAHRECILLGPCDFACEPVPAILEDVDTVRRGVGIPTLPPTVLEPRRP